MKWLRDIRTKLRPEEVIALIFWAAFAVSATPRRRPRHGRSWTNRRAGGIFSVITVAGVAQLAEQLICNQQVISSSLIAGSRLLPLALSFLRSPTQCA